MLPKEIRRILSRDVPTAYVPLIARMRFFIEPEISCSRFFAEACFTKEALTVYRNGGARSVLEPTELGDFIGKRLCDGLFIDIPCGLPGARDPNHDFDLVPLVHSLGFSSYFEVDLTADVVRDRIAKTIDVTNGGTGYRLVKGIGEIGVREEDSFPVATMQDDLLGFVAKLSEPRHRPPLALYISALQPDEALCKTPDGQRRIIVPYLEALYREIERFMGADDLLILNSAAMLITGIDETAFPEIDPTVALFQRGFALLRRCAYDKVRIYVKDPSSAG